MNVPNDVNKAKIDSKFDPNVGIEEATGFLTHNGKKYRVKLVTQNKETTIKDLATLKMVTEIIYESKVNLRPSLNETVISAENITVKGENNNNVVQKFNPEQTKKITQLFQSIVKANQAENPLVKSQSEKNLLKDEAKVKELSPQTNETAKKPVDKVDNKKKESNEDPESDSSNSLENKVPKDKAKIKEPPPETNEAAKKPDEIEVDDMYMPESDVSSQGEFSLAEANDSENYWNDLETYFLQFDPDAPVPVRGIISPENLEDKDKKDYDAILPVLGTNIKRFNPHLVKIRGDGNCGFRAMYVGLLNHFIEEKGLEGIRSFITYTYDSIGGEDHLFDKAVKDKLSEFIKSNSSKSELLIQVLDIFIDEELDQKMCSLMRQMAVKQQLKDRPEIIKDGVEQKKLEIKASFIPKPEKPANENADNWAEDTDFFALAKIFHVPVAIANTYSKDAQVIRISEEKKIDLQKVPLTSYICLVATKDHINLIIGHADEA